MFCGNRIHKNYISELAFGSNKSESYLGKLYLWHILFLIIFNKKKCSLIVIEGNNLHQFIFVKKDSFFIPVWIKGIVDIPLVATNRSLKEDMRVIRKNQLDFMVTTDLDHIYDFYHNMYLPSIRVRHEERAFEIDFSSIQKEVENCDCKLLLVTQENKTISGVLLVDGNIPRLWVSGVRDANPIFWKCGAIGATYYFASLYWAERGYKQMNLGLTRGFLNDGVLQYKKKLNFVITGHDPNGFIIKPLNISSGLVAFLIGNPFVYLNDNKLISAVFMKKDKKSLNKVSEERQKKYDIKGLNGLNIFLYDEHNNKIIKKSRL